MKITQTHPKSSPRDPPPTRSKLVILWSELLDALVVSPIFHLDEIWKRFGLEIQLDYLGLWFGNVVFLLGFGLSEATVHVVTTLGSVNFGICGKLLVILLLFMVVLHPVY
ncbi:hypothetical protein FQA39_LY05427 [Lamprigera yunnana]|nr:hypothetical protein FQA39_LY05427 [Lamprigera yunnana]